MKSAPAAAARPPARAAARPGAGLFRACLCLLALALAGPPDALRAQSGRNKKPAAPAPRGGGDTRPRPSADAPPSPAPATRTQGTGNEPSSRQKPAGGPTSATAAKPRPAGVGDAGAPTAEEVGEEEVVRISSNLVPVPATVLDAQGRAVVDLQLKDFELLVDGQPKLVAELYRAETPVTLALLFDNSSSLASAREFEKQAAKRFFNSVMRPADRAAVYGVSESVDLAQPLTGDVRALTRTIDNFGKPQGATALFDAIAEAAKYLKPQSGRKVIVIISDGVDTISDLDFDATLARVLISDCQVYAVRTGHSDNTNLRDLAAERRLQEFAAQTGGAVYVPRGNDELDGAFAQISADLAHQYVLSYYPSDERRDGSFRTFSLRVSTRPNLRVRTRKGYYAPKPEARKS